MELHNLRFFVAAAEEGSFTRAAAKLGVAQPSISQALRRLEVELGTPLFHRLGRGVELSSAGIVLLQTAQRILVEIDEAQIAIGALKGLDGGKVVVAAPPGLTLDPGVSAISQFHRAHPSVVVSLMASDDGAAALRAVSGGECEIALTDRTEIPSDLVAIRIAENELVLVAPRGRHNRGAAVEFWELDGEPFISSSPGTQTFALLKALEHKGIQPRVIVEHPHREATVPLILQGVGSAIMNRALASSAEAAGADVFSFSPIQTYDVLLVHRSGMLTPAAQAFVQLIARLSEINISRT